MAQIGVAPKVQKNLRLKVGDDNYELHVSSVDWTPASTQQTWQGGTPEASFTDQSVATWTCNITAIQDFETTDSFVNLCLANAGEAVEVEYTRDAADAFKFTATITLVPPTIGGPVGQYNEATMAFGSTKPERVAVA